MCCYLPSLLPDQLFKPGVVVRAEVPSQFAAGRENRTIKKKTKNPKTLPLSASIAAPLLSLWAPHDWCSHLQIIHH